MIVTAKWRKKPYSEKTWKTFKTVFMVVDDDRKKTALLHLKQRQPTKYKKYSNKS